MEEDERRSSNVPLPNTEKTVLLHLLLDGWFD